MAALSLFTLLLINRRIHLRCGRFEHSLTREDWQTLDRINDLYHHE
jgi:hypothetical protein